jgi:hypothetical protein
MKRALAMEHLRCAFRRGDLSEATRVYIENRISWQTYQQTAREVARAKAQAASRSRLTSAPSP